MKYHAFYINGDLLVRCINKETTSFEKKENVAVLYNKDEVIGYNIFNFKTTNINEGLVKLNDEINDAVNERLTMIGETPLEIDSNDYIVIGYVKEIEKHPDSTKLNICKVDLGNEEVQIVCGAPNVDANQRVVVSKPGAVLFNGTWLKKGKLLGVESNGMICSARELGLNIESNGILVLDDSYKIGEKFTGLK